MPGPDPSRPGAPGPRGWRRAWPVLRLVVGLGLAALAGWALDGKRGELSDAAYYLEHLHGAFVAAAVVAEAAAVASFAALQRGLLAAGRLRAGMGQLVAITLAGNSINNSLPGGVAFASAFAFRQYRRLGASEALAAWTVVATGLAAAIALALLAAVGVAVPGSEASNLNLIGVVLLALVATLAVSGALFVVLWRLRALEATVGLAVRLSQRTVGLPRGRADEVAAALVSRLRAVRPDRRSLLWALAFAMGNWVLDCFALAASFAAVGSGVPWSGLLLAYGAGQLAANLPITPGGLGVVEGSLTIALVAYGGAEGSTVAAVLLYRLVSFWGTLPLGWLAWAGLAVAGRSPRPAPAEVGAE
jgi:uncharacterized protein (TIRG00374 family)